MYSEPCGSAPRTTTLADFTSPGLIVPRLRGEEAASAIKELTEVLRLDNRLSDALPFYQAALNREFLAGADVEGGMALPHARVAGLKEVTFAVGRSPQPLPWGMHAAPSVRLVFLLAVPATDATQYLLVISGLARLSKNADLMSRLLEAVDAPEMIQVLQRVGLSSHPAS